jgi:FtsP/CotA-like multicopper oxidase with cupredoxin domain
LNRFICMNNHRTKQHLKAKPVMTSWKDKLARTAQQNRQEIIKARLSRREMMRLGLLTAGGSLVLKQGLSARAFADDGTLTFFKGVDGPPSPPADPWAQPMPILPVKQPVDPDQLTFGRPDGTTLIDGATKRINHQLFQVDPATGAFVGKFPPRKFYELNIQEVAVKVHPAYEKTTVWGFDGMVPGPNIQARYGEPVLVRFRNSLPSVNVRQSFGIAEVSTHLHNSHTPTESDGNPVDFFNSVNDTGPLTKDANGNPVQVNPHGFKDHHFPNVLAGYTARNDLVGDPAEALGSLWYHDHHLDFTAQNVYKGMFGCYNLFDDQDAGDEATGFHLPSGPFDIPIFFNDFLFDQDFQLVFDLFDLDGILGDKFCANGAIQPFLNVDKRRYRFRLYNPGPSRWYEFALFDGTNFLPFWQISCDGNLLPQAVQVSSVRLAVAERVDIVVDFSKINASRLFLVNRLEQVNGRGPTGNILTPGTPIVQINIGSLPAQKDGSADPANGLTLRALPDPDFAALLARAATAKTRTWVFDRGEGAWQVNGKFFDPTVANAMIDQESEEVWIIRNGGGGWRHPIHAHFEEHRVLSVDGVLVQPGVQTDGTINAARRDVVPLNPSSEVRTFRRLRDMKGRYVMHCHNVVHEDHAMMIRFDIV